MILYKESIELAMETLPFTDLNACTKFTKKVQFKGNKRKFFKNKNL